MSVEVPRQRILIVDDEPVNIHVLSEALQGAYELRFATSGKRALDLLHEYVPDLLLLDVVMPDPDGFEVLRRLRDIPGMDGVPVIFVTAMSEVDDEERGFNLGAVDYILKPISAPIVRARVRTHLELKRQRDLLARGALMDGLTNIANRRRFDEVLQRRWRSAQRHAAKLSLMLLDIDHFKQFNDSYGHSAGDDCLRRVAAALDQAFTRGEDLVARYGGEEFALILAPGEVETQAARVLRVIADLQIPHQASSASPRVSASVGAMELAPSEGSTIALALQQVDELLYQAKQTGRDRCMVKVDVDEQARCVRG